MSTAVTIPAKVKSLRLFQATLVFVGHFHLWMAITILIFALISFTGCALAGIQMSTNGGNWAFYLVIGAMLLPLPFYWYEKNRPDLLDSGLLLLWAWLESVIIPSLVRAVGRLRMPLQDSLLGNVDQRLGVSVPALMAWSQRHWIGRVTNQSYAWVIILVPMAVLLPILARRPKYTRRLVVANMVSFAVGIPMFALLPAVGPWRYYHFAPNQLQTTLCEIPLLALRVHGPYTLHSASSGIVCFPSFHVVWAIICAATLWGFKYLRVPACLACTLVVISTMTTGWHYFADVLGGIALAALSLFVAEAVVRCS